MTAALAYAVQTITDLLTEENAALNAMDSVDGVAPAIASFPLARSNSPA